MSATVEAKPLREAMAFAMRAIDTRQTIPILANVLLKTEDTILWIVATDLDIEVRIAVDASIETPFAMTASAADIANFAKRVPPGSQIRIAQDDHAVRLTCGRARATLGLLPADDFPTMPADEGQGEPVEAKALRDLLAFCIPCISKEETRYYLNGVFLHTPASRMRAVATNGHIFAMADGPDWPKVDGVIVPMKTCGLLTAMEDGEVTLAIAETRITVTRPRLSITSKVIDGQFPDYMRIVPRESGEIAVTVESEALRDAVQLALVGVDTKLTNAIRISTGDDRVGVRGGNEAQGTETEIDAKTSEGGPPFGFNAAYLTSILGIYGDGPVDIDGESPRDAFRFTRKGDDDHLAIVMPMRV